MTLIDALKALEARYGSQSIIHDNARPWTIKELINMEITLSSISPEGEDDNYYLDPDTGRVWECDEQGFLKSQVLLELAPD
jgi:hypothetical protein